MMNIHTDLVSLQPPQHHQPQPQPSRSALHNVKQWLGLTSSTTSAAAAAATDEDANRLAIESLLRKLERLHGRHNSRAQMAQLESALAHPDRPSPCVCIAQSPDAHMRYGQRSLLQHYVFCRVWRWPDLTQNDQLEPVAHCQHPYDGVTRKSAKREPMPMVCVNPTHYTRVSRVPQVMVQMGWAEQQQQQQQQQDMQQPAFKVQRTDIPFSSVMAAADHEMGDASPVHSTDSGVYSAPNSPLAMLQCDLDAADQQLLQQIVHAIPDSVAQQLIRPNTMEYRPTSGDQAATAALAAQSVSLARQQAGVPFVEPVHWASIAYYELSQRIGDTFQCFNHATTVDGYTAPVQPRGDRMSLGALPNGQGRAAAADSVRRHIGAGIRLEYDRTHRLVLRNRSEVPVFVQSGIMNRVRGHAANAVNKVPAGGELVVFDMMSFMRTLDDAASRGFEEVCGLTQLCTMRVSFAKGWGAEYQRQVVTAVPCWVEVHMNGALQWLDRVMQTMGGPAAVATSMS